MELHRINSRVSNSANDWLDRRSIETGISKSSLVMMAIENYMRETEALSAMNDLNALASSMTALVEKVEQLQATVERKGLE